MPVMKGGKLPLVWALAPFSQTEHLVAQPVEERTTAACDKAKYAAGTWEATPPDAQATRCVACSAIGGPGGWGEELVVREVLE